MIRRGALLCAALALTACQTDPGPGSGPAPDADTYRLVQLDGLPPPWTVTLRFGPGGQVSGQAPCNLYFATVERNSGSIRFEQIGMTEMACMDQTRMQGDAQFVALLSAMKDVVETGPQLQLSGAGHVLVFARP